MKLKNGCKTKFYILYWQKCYNYAACNDSSGLQRTLLDFCLLQLPDEEINKVEEFLLGQAIIQFVIFFFWKTFFLTHQFR